MANPDHTFPKPIFILRVSNPVFDMLINPLLEGFDEINLKGNATH